MKFHFVISLRGKAAVPPPRYLSEGGEAKILVHDTNMHYNSMTSSERQEKGSQREPKGTKGSQMGAKSEQKGYQNGVKMVPK